MVLLKKMPCFVIDAYSLHTIPRSHPEELCDISLVDRLNRLEKQVTTLQEALDFIVCENISLKEKINANPQALYSTVTSRPASIVAQLPTSNNRPGESNVEVNQTVPGEINTTVNTANGSVNQADMDITRQPVSLFPMADQ